MNKKLGNHGPAPNAVAVYHAAVGPTPDGYSGRLLEFPGVVATGKDKADLSTHLSEALALHLHGEAPDHRPKALTPQAARKQLEADEVLLDVAPAPMNPVSLLIGDALRATGKSLRQLAREYGTTHAVLSRLQDPFYWGHSLHSLLQLADWLNLEVEVKFKVPGSGPQAA